MEIMYLSDFNSFKKEELAVTIGAYDGFHLGHLQVVKTLFKYKGNYKTAVITFSKHPDYYLNKRENLGLLNTSDEKINIFRTLGFDYLIFLGTSLELLSKSYQEFNECLKKINVKMVSVGKDFTYGYKGLGSYKTLKKDFTVHIAKEIKYQGHKLCSSDIRYFLKIGNVDEIANVTGSFYSVCGIVEKGDHIGSKIGFPTANISLGEKYSDIRFGVYKTNITIHNKDYLGMANIGYNPSINLLKKPRLEVHIFDFNENIYGEYMKIELVRFIRDEIKFANEEELIAQIEKDKEEVLKI